jgi:hypothetical protein
MFFLKIMRGRENQLVKEMIERQTKENINELEKLGIQFVSFKEYLNNKDKYPYAIGILPKQNK